MGRFHRSRLFWSGLLVTVALLWGWLAFPQRITTLSHVKGAHSLWIGDRSRGLCVGWVDTGLVRLRPGLMVTGNDEGSGLREEERRILSPAVRCYEDHHELARLRSVYFFVSYWLILLVWLAVWLPGLWWRQRHAGR